MPGAADPNPPTGPGVPRSMRPRFERANIPGMTSHTNPAGGRRAGSRAVWRTLFAIALVSAIAPGCSTNPVSGKRQVILMSQEQEKKIDEEVAQQVAAQIGLVDDPKLTAYVEQLGQALARKSPRQDVRYRFHVVAMEEPNAFALPGGNIYVSRGLLALLNNEAELANVLGHEIGHVAARHAAQRDALVKLMTVLNTVGMIGAAAGGARYNGNGGPIGNPGLFSFSRDQESEADEIGQNLAVAAGIDPAGMAGLLRSLDAHERLNAGFSRETGYFDTHPAARERAAETATSAQARRFDGQFRIAESDADFLDRMSDISIGSPAADGVIEQGRLTHADLDFTLRFPQGWTIENTRAAAYAISPQREAVVVLELQGEGDDPEAAAHEWLRGKPMKADSGAIKIGDLEAFRIRGELPTPAGRTLADVTWISHGGHIYRLSGFMLANDFERFAGVFRSFPRSFRPLTEEERGAVTELRLRVVDALEGETIASLGERTGNQWSVVETAVHNAIRPGEALAEGRKVKIAVRVPYQPHRERPPGEPIRRRPASDSVTSDAPAPEANASGS